MTNTATPLATQPSEELAALSELTELVNQRAKTYGLLARLYHSEIDQAFLDTLHAMRFPARTHNESADKGYRLIAGYLSNLWENSLEELAVDYSRVFIGQGIDAYSAAYPFESVYTSEKRLLMQDARDEVLAIYRSQGLDKRSTWKEGEDHIAMELEFMQLLCERTSEALEQGDEERAYSLLSTQLNFLNDHLISWAPMMTEDVQKFAQTELYQGLAHLTDGFLESDKEFLQALVSDD